jgi:hypothetical protein
MALRGRVALLALAAAAAAAAAPPAPQSRQQPPPREALVRVLWRLASAGDAGRLRQVATAQPWLLNESVGGAGVIVPLLEGWHAAIEALPSLTPAGADHESALGVLLHGGADPALGCPLLDALVTRNAAAVKALLRVSRPAALARCLASYDATGQGLLHAAARTPASGLARHLYRTSAASSIAMEAAGDAAAVAAAVARARQVLDVHVAGTPLDTARSTQQRRRRRRRQQLRTVTKSAIEAAAGDAALTALLAAARRLNKKLLQVAAAGTVAAGAGTAPPMLSTGGDGDSDRLPPPLAPSEWLELHDGAGHTPLTLACAHGRARAVAALFKAGADPRALAQTSAGAGEVDESSGTPQQPAPVTTAAAAPPVGTGLACAHAAASRGHVDVLEALCAGVAGGDACAVLLAGHPDAHGRSAADVAAAHDRALFAPVREWIAQRVAAAAAAAGGQAVEQPQRQVPQQHVAVASDGAPAWPRLPPHWDAARHANAGWAVASPAQLARVGLPPALFDGGGSSEAESSSTGAAASSCGGCAVSSVVDEVPPEWLMAPAGSSDGAALHRGFLSIGKPFVVRQWAQFRAAAALNGSSTIAGGNDAGAAVGADASLTPLPVSLLAWLSGYLPSSAFTAPGARLGELVVAPGGVPYADTYAYRDDDDDEDGVVNGGAQRPAAAKTMTLAAFVGSHMGAGAEAARAAAVLAAPGSGNASASSSARRPPYVFDGRAMHAQPAVFGRLLAALLPDALGKGHGGGADGSGAGSSTSPPQPPPPAHQLRQLIVGPPLSGAQPHFHGPAVNVLLAGAKAWELTPPAHAGFVRSHAADWFAAGGYCHAADGDGDGAGGPAAGCVPHLRFLQGPGDLVWVPEHWGHAVLNLADAVAVAVE